MAANFANGGGQRVLQPVHDFPSYCREAGFLKGGAGAGGFSELRRGFCNSEDETPKHIRKDLRSMAYFANAPLAQALQDPLG